MMRKCVCKYSFFGVSPLARQSIFYKWNTNSFLRYFQTIFTNTSHSICHVEHSQLDPCGTQGILKLSYSISQPLKAKLQESAVFVCIKIN